MIISKVGLEMYDGISEVGVICPDCKTRYMMVQDEVSYFCQKCCEIFVWTKGDLPGQRVIGGEIYFSTDWLDNWFTTS